MKDKPKKFARIVGYVSLDVKAAFDEKRRALIAAGEFVNESKAVGLAVEQWLKRRGK